MIGTIDIKCNAAHPNLPLSPLYTFKDSPSSIRVMDVPKKVGNWSIDKVALQITYPDGSIVSKECVKNGALWVGTIEGTTAIGKVQKGFVVVASGKNENGEVVNGYVLGVGDVVVMDFDGTIETGTTATNIHLLTSMPQEPKTGDAYLDGNALMVYDGNTWTKVGGQNIPTKVSQLENDKGYLTTVYWNDVRLKPTIPTKVSQLQNDSNFGDKWKIFSQDNNQYLNGDLEVYSMIPVWKCEDDVDREFELYFDGMGGCCWKATWPDTMGGYITAYSRPFSSMEEAENADSIFLQYGNSEIWCWKYNQPVKQDDVATQNYVNQQIGDVLTQEEF